MTVDEIIIDYLKTNRFDGLANSEDECGCGIEDFHPCGEIKGDCFPAYKHQRSECECCNECGVDINTVDCIYCGHKPRKGE